MSFGTVRNNRTGYPDSLVNTKQGIGSFSMQLRTAECEIQGSEKCFLTKKNT